MRKPANGEYPSYYQQYIDLVPSGDVLRELAAQVMSFQAVVSQIPEEKENYRYADGKWTIKEVIGHIIDTERILGYRALRFARKDTTPLPGFEENDYVKNANFNDQTLYSLAHEFALVREANMTMFRQWNEEVLDQRGKANNQEVSVRAVLFMMAGHATHHLKVLRLRYLLD